LINITSTQHHLKPQHLDYHWCWGFLASGMLSATSRLTFYFETQPMELTYHHWWSCHRCHP